MQLTFFGGINEIGGNKILLEDNATRIFLDFGTSYKMLSMFYDEFMRPRKSNGLGDFFEMGLLPDLKGLYRNDFLARKHNREEKPEFNGVVLTHAHLDHVGAVAFLNKDIDIFSSNATKTIMKVIQDVRSGFDTQLVVKKEEFTGLPWNRVPRFKRRFNILESEKRFAVNGLEITPIFVDHSIAGASGYIVHTSNGDLVYTGDLRKHGNNPEKTKRFIEVASSSNAKVLVCEGTRIMEGESVSESQVKEKISDIISKTKGLVIANFPPRDIDRLNSFYKAAKENDRKLVIELRQAYLLKMLEDDKDVECPSVNDGHILIYAKRFREGFFAEGLPGGEQEYPRWARPFLKMKNFVTYKDIKDMQSEVVFFCNSWSFGELVDIKPVNGSSYIYSLTEPFNDEMELDWRRVENWLNHFNLPLYKAHASGHMSRDEIIDMINQIKPEIVIPVHTENAKQFRDIVPSESKVILTKINEKLTV